MSVDAAANARLPKASDASSSDTEPLRADILSPERLEDLAVALATADVVSKKAARRPPLSVRLRDNERMLLKAYKSFAAAVEQRKAISPAAEWVLDNFHVVEEQIREIRQDLPPGYYRELPKLATGTFKGYPRVFGLAWAYVEHTDSRFEPDLLKRFLQAYQRVRPLTIGELWAVAITLRVVLVENLRRCAERSVRASHARAEADLLADRLLGVHGHEAAGPDLDAMHSAGSSMESAFATQLVLRLRDLDPQVTPARAKLSQRLAKQGTTAERLVVEEHWRQSIANVTVRNIITSMRLMSDVDWAELFESVSLVDARLREGSGYPSMDFVTRNQYRSAIEDLARRSRLSELEIAERVLTQPIGAGDSASARSSDPVEQARLSDPGHRLLGAGKAAFQRDIGYRLPLLHRPRQYMLQRGTFFYLTAAILLSIAVLAAPLWALANAGVQVAMLAALAILGAIPATDVALGIVNRFVSRRISATILPSLALRDGVPAELRTMIVVPMLLTTKTAILEQIDRLEIHHLASLSGELHFALLADGVDGPLEHDATDNELVLIARAGIDRLNKTYPTPSGEARFLMLHRRRVWNESQQQWMGWERKRGKLHELNRLLRGATDTTFVGVDDQPPTVPAGVRFIITLDSDTRLPRDTARRLIGKLGHPINRPRFDPASGRVVDGYAILQPRVTASLPTGLDGSLFQRIFSNSPGIDPYAAAASDVYQDLFGEGSYAGKGIYDIDAFESALAGRVPASSLLSHDLFEGLFARAGLASDVEVVEDYPERYDVATLRQHRWTRGDWQLLPWIIGRADVVGRATGLHQTLPLISVWKMVDNLRRSLSAPTAVAAMLVGWQLPLSQAALWTGFILATICWQPLLPALESIIPRRRGITLRSHALALGRDTVRAFAQALLLIVFLAHLAFLMVDAISRSIFRLFLSHRNLLQWVTAAQSGATRSKGLAGLCRYMRFAIGLGLGLVVICLIRPFDAWPVILPLALAWVASPFVAQWVSRTPTADHRMATSAGDAQTLRLVARRTWRYFERFVGPEDQMLPPDNVQEDPVVVVAHRTSPTNIGLYLLAIVSAHDFGWIGVSEAADRFEETLATMARLQRYRGHFLNWYETRGLRPLEPTYVSSVDSGNLCAHLLALAAACRELAANPGAVSSAREAIADALTLAQNSTSNPSEEPPAQRLLRREFDALLRRTLGRLQSRARASETASMADAQLPADLETLAGMARALCGGDADDDVTYWTDAAHRSWLGQHAAANLTPEDAGRISQRLAASGLIAQTMANEMEFGFLFDQERRLLSIGARPSDGSLDSSCYDLLASEARLASFVAIAKGDIPSRHWFRLGRSVVPVGGGAALISWSGSMFEYLMPSLVMRAPGGSLLEQTSRLIVRGQRRYAAGLALPWGISESAYNARDSELTYQYSNFGVPTLGLKRGLRDDVVIAPYATALAAMVEPVAATDNFLRLHALGATGRYGFYEAIDYTRRRLPSGVPFAIVRAFMAHHQGMTIVAIGNVVHDGRMRERFHTDPSVRASELLLHERPPRDVSVAHPWVADQSHATRPAALAAVDVRRETSPYTLTPRTHLISNGRLTTMITAAGAGYTRWRELAITRWREDPTREHLGSFIYVRDSSGAANWSVGHQPTGVDAQAYEATFADDRVSIGRRDGHLLSTMDVVISPEDDAEARSITITNTGPTTREVDVTSYIELVLAPLGADVAHPAFSKLFVQTEFDPALGAVIATRRRRSEDEPEIWAAHHLVIEGEAIGPTTFETDRARFIGRGHDLRTPAAQAPGAVLSGSVGTVLDGIFAMRQRMRIAPDSTIRLTYWTTAASTREALRDLVDRNRAPNSLTRANMLAWTYSQVQLRQIGITTAEASLYQRLAGHLLFTTRAMRPPTEVVEHGAAGPTGLWTQGISGDLPILLLRIDDADDMGFVRQLLKAHEYWRTKGFAVDLVILNERASSYVQDLQNALNAATRTGQPRPAAPPGGGGIFVLRADVLTAETRALLGFAARAVLYPPRGDLASQLDRADRETRRQPRPARRSGVPIEHSEAADSLDPSLEFFNGLGGFGADGTEYVVRLRTGEATPAPWINVIANPTFGFQVSAEGAGYTWSRNSRECQLTAWSNDPVIDPASEVLYIRDEDSGQLWTPTALPIRLLGSTYVARHGQGYSRFEHASHGIDLQLLQFVPLDDSIKISRLSVRNDSSRRRHLSLTAYAEWFLGPPRASRPSSIVTSLDAQTGAVLARNPWSSDFGTRIAFADLSAQQTEWTTDRREFLGRFGSTECPSALESPSRLSGQVGAVLDPCAALRTHVVLEPGEKTEIVFLLGDGSSSVEARALVIKYRGANLDDALHKVRRHWDDLLGAVQVQTPDRALNVLLNRWLLYQTVACRLWARSAFYQASGAYGFRDQLQDGMALVLTRPDYARTHLLRAAGRQFLQGDVQHWWLPHSGQGVRTRIADDRVWLPYAAHQFVHSTGDSGVLDEQVAFLEGQALAPHEADAFFTPAVADERASLYEHCARALDQSLAVGVHGLPLIGTGDWNDGMNRVGELGRGESIWLGWLLVGTLRCFAPYALARGETARASRWQAHATDVCAALETSGWDGEWYRRAYYDDGSPLGSHLDDECRIDAIAQSWSVISGCGNPSHARAAMEAVRIRLIRPVDHLALLFTPPFDRTAQQPGYIKGYPPGIRENGGQYTHAAAWTVIAQTLLGDGDEAVSLLSMLNPIEHTRTRTAVEAYKVEPYVVAADIYSVAPHVGRGGWTWYTGSASWLYRAAVEFVIGCRREGAFLVVNPCLPRSWPRVDVVHRYRSSTYEIEIRNPDGLNRGVANATLDGTALAIDTVKVELVDDGQSHRVVVTLGIPPGGVDTSWVAELPPMA